MRRDGCRSSNMAQPSAMYRSRRRNSAARACRRSVGPVPRFDCQPDDHDMQLHCLFRTFGRQGDARLGPRGRYSDSRMFVTGQPPPAVGAGKSRRMHVCANPEARDSQRPNARTVGPPGRQACFAPPDCVKRQILRRRGPVGQHSRPAQHARVFDMWARPRDSIVRRLHHIDLSLPDGRAQAVGRPAGLCAPCNAGWPGQWLASRPCAIRRPAGRGRRSLIIGRRDIPSVNRASPICRCDPGAISPTGRPGFQAHLGLDVAQRRLSR